MPTLDAWVTVVYGVDDTFAADAQRVQKVFAALPLTLKATKFTLTKDQTQAILGTDGKLALSGGPTQFDADLPAGAGSSKPRPVTVKDPNGRFTSEVWAAIKNWTDLGGLHIFYVPDFDPPGGEGGICLRVGDQIDPIIFVNQKANQNLLKQTKNLRGVLEHEVGHAFGLPDIIKANALMNGVISSDASDAGIALSQDEIQVIKGSRLLRLASASAGSGSGAGKN